MQITLNGEPKTLDAQATLTDLLEQLNLVPQRVAVEVNEQLVRRAEFARTHLRDGDRVEIVTLVGGG